MIDRELWIKEQDFTSFTILESNHKDILREFQSPKQWFIVSLFGNKKRNKSKVGTQIKYVLGKHND